MYIPESVLSEAVELLSQDEDEALQRLGSELYSLERQQPVHALVSTIPAQDLEQKAIDYLNSKREVLKKAICQDWREKSREDFLDASKLLAHFVNLIAGILNLTLSYVTIPMLVAVILIKRGINKLCEEEGGDS